MWALYRFLTPVLVGLWVAFPASVAGAGESSRDIFEAPRPPVEDLVAAVVAAPDDVRALVALGLADLEAKNVDDAVEVLRRAVAVGPDFAPALLALANALNAKGAAILKAGGERNDRSGEAAPWFATADERFEMATRLNPDDDFAWLTWGNALLARNRTNLLLLPTTPPGPVLEKLRTAYRLNPSEVKIAKYLAGTLAFYGTAFVTYLEPHFSDHPDRSSLPGWVLDIADFGAVGRQYLEEAVDLFEVVRSHSPDDVSIFYHYIPTLVRFGRVGDAIAACREVMDRNPHTPTARRTHEYWYNAISRAYGQGAPKDELMPFFAQYEEYKTLLPARNN